MSKDLPELFGPVDSPIIRDEFSFEDVKGLECYGRVARNICRYLLDQIKVIVKK